jgi:N-sulfoglucosamine sulfohydrolase
MMRCGSVLLLVGLATAAHSGAAEPAGDRPNILLITADDMSWDSAGVYGCPVAETTPNLDQLAARGMRFDYAFVQIAVCTPSRQVMLSGNHSHQTMTRGFTELERVGPALPDLLKQHGYYLANLNKTQDHYTWDRLIREDDTAMGRDIPRQRALVAEIIRDSGDQPWFIMMNFNDPHRPFFDSEAERSKERYQKFQKAGRLSQPSKIFTPDEVVVPGFLPDLPAVRQEMAEYYSSVRRMDDGVGAVLAALEESGESGRTIVVFISDHGISMPYAKLNCYQASLRVPFVIHAPGVTTPNSRNTHDLVSAVDLAPTLLDLAGIVVPGHMAGRSFAPLLRGAAQERRDFVIGYYYRNLRAKEMYPEFTVQMRDWTYVYNPWVDGTKEAHNSDYTHSPSLAAIWKAAESSPAIRQRSEFHKYRVIEELYDLRADPHAYHNLAAVEEYAPVVRQMRQRLVEWMRATDHPALPLMQDPLNPERIAGYLEWETRNAVKQIDEVEGGRRATARDR